MRSTPLYDSRPSKAPGPKGPASTVVGAKALTPKVPTASEVAASLISTRSAASGSAPASSTAGPGSDAGPSSEAILSSQGAGSSAVASRLPPTQSTTTTSEVSRSGSRSRSGSARVARPTYIIKPAIVGLPTGGSHGPAIPTHTFLSTSISLLLYLAVMIITCSVDCPFDREVTQFFIFVLLAFTGSLFMMVINLTAVKYHRYNCVSTSLSLLYSGSAALVVYGLVDTSIRGLCKPNQLKPGTIFKSGLTSNFAVWIMTSLSVLWQLIAYYYYG